MKFGRIVYSRADGSTKHGNLGNYYQTFAIDYILQELGIAKEEIIDIRHAQMPEYQGEKIRLVYNAWLNPAFDKDFFPISDSIDPIYFGVHRITGKNLRSKDFEGKLVGCRDENTYSVFRKKGVDAYISGCSTIVFPTRTTLPSDPTIFLVDVPSYIEDKIPADVKQGRKIVKLSQERSDMADIEKEARDLLELYREKACLVVTSRLHCAAPCLAMGIPVILFRKYYDERYSWIDKYIPLYRAKDIDRINWSPEVVDMTYPKKLILDMFRALLVEENEDKYRELARELSEFYRGRNKQSYYRTPIITRIFLGVRKSNPKLANYLRDNIFKAFTAAGRK